MKEEMEDEIPLRIQQTEATQQQPSTEHTTASTKRLVWQNGKEGLWWPAFKEQKAGDEVEVTLLGRDRQSIVKKDQNTKDFLDSLPFSVNRNFISTITPPLSSSSNNNNNNNNETKIKLLEALCIAHDWIIKQIEEHSKQPIEIDSEEQQTKQDDDEERMKQLLNSKELVENLINLAKQQQQQQQQQSLQQQQMKTVHEEIELKSHTFMGSACPNGNPIGVIGQYSGSLQSGFIISVNISGKNFRGFLLPEDRSQQQQQQQKAIQNDMNILGRSLVEVGIEAVNRFNEESKRNTVTSFTTTNGAGGDDEDDNSPTNSLPSVPITQQVQPIKLPYSLPVSTTTTTTAAAASSSLQSSPLSTTLGTKRGRTTRTTIRQIPSKQPALAPPLPRMTLQQVTNNSPPSPTNNPNAQPQTKQQPMNFPVNQLINSPSQPQMSVQQQQQLLKQQQLQQRQQQQSIFESPQIRKSSPAATTTTTTIQQQQRQQQLAASTLRGFSAMRSAEMVSPSRIQPPPIQINSIPPPSTSSVTTTQGVLSPQRNSGIPVEANLDPSTPVINQTIMRAMLTANTDTQFRQASAKRLMLEQTARHFVNNFSQQQQQQTRQSPPQTAQPQQLMEDLSNHSDDATQQKQQTKMN